MANDLEDRLHAVRNRGVRIVDPRQTFVGEDVVLDRLCAGAVLHPGTRLHGPRTALGPDAHVGVEGPAVLVDTVLDRGAVIHSGHAHGAVLLEGASAGANAHLRPGTLLEEHASTAHAVGLKHTILLPFVTMGSLINFCDALVAGGTSRRDHTEIGSGYIHFNYTPFGREGDKATPSLVGDVVHGVFLREPRIFLGGMGGMVGPRQVGYGSTAAAGQVLRRDLPAGKLRLSVSREIERDLAPGRVDRIEPRRQQNLAYIGQLAALRAFYREVRVPRAKRTGRPWQIAAVEAASAIVDDAIVERVRRLTSFVEERGESLGPLDLDVARDGPCPIPLEPYEPSHVEFVQELPDEVVEQGRAWLGAIAHRVAFTK